MDKENIAFIYNEILFRDKKKILSFASSSVDELRKHFASPKNRNSALSHSYLESKNFCLIEV